MCVSSSIRQWVRSRGWVYAGGRMGLGFHFRILGFGEGGNRLEPLVIGFVLSGGLCRLSRFLGWRGLGTGFRGLCGGVFLLYVCPSVYLGVHSVSSLLRSVLIGFVCVLSWPLCFFGGGGPGML